MTGSGRFHSDRVLEFVQRQVWASAHVPYMASVLLYVIPEKPIS